MVTLAKKSMKYLTEKYKIKEKEAKRLYELVGRHIINLKSVVNKYLARQKFKGRN
jgi:hypothetical protein